VTQPICPTSVWKRTRKPAKLGREPLRSKQTAKKLARFDVSIHVGRSHNWDGHIVLQTLMIPFGVIVSEVASDDSSLRVAVSPKRINL
jgi:hypothetical protein